MDPKEDERRKNNVKMVSEIKIYNEVEAQKVIIIDFRSRKDFNSGCLFDFSINLPYDEVGDDILEDPGFFSKGLLEKFAHSEFLEDRASRIKRYFVAIIMSQNKIRKHDIMSYVNGIDSAYEFSEELTKPIKLYNNLIQNKVREIGLYTRGFNLFRNKFPFLIHTNQKNPTLLYIY